MAARSSDELIGQVVAAVRVDRPNGHGMAWESLEGQRDQRCRYLLGVKWSSTTYKIKIIHKGNLQ